MTFVSVSKIAEDNRKRGGLSGGLGNRTTPYIGLSAISAGRQGKNGKKRAVCVMYSLHQDIIKKARFVRGDRIDVLVDAETRQGLIKRVSSGGYCLSISGTKTIGKSESTLAKYKMNFKMTHYYGMPLPSQPEIIQHYTITDDGIQFVFPASVKL